MTVLTATRPNPSALAQWWVMTTRFIVPTLRNGELITAISASVAFTAGFYIPLHEFMAPVIGGMSSYGQFLMPLIALQGVYFAAMSTAFRAATDSVSGLTRRYGSMPIAPMTPVIARLSASLYRCLIGIAVALICGHVIGFRFYGGFLHTAGFVALLIVLGMLLSLVGDVFGTASRNPEAAMQWMLLPQMILGMLSVGFQPAELFPKWIQSFVRNQPISQWVSALRALAGDSTPAAGTVTWKLLAISVAWVVGLALVMGPLSASVQRRRS
jgi:ABC-2 type transport system permease protein